MYGHIYTGGGKKKGKKGGKGGGGKYFDDLGGSKKKKRGAHCRFIFLATREKRKKGKTNCTARYLFREGKMGVMSRSQTTLSTQRLRPKGEKEGKRGKEGKKKEGVNGLNDN